MGVPLLILLGAAGGALRGLLEAYNRFREWQTDRRDHRRLPAGGLPAGEGGEPPRFSQYFDPVADPVAVLVHSAMGAGTAVLFGTTGQISGAYAALVVGASAPVILTQLGRVHAIGDAITVIPPPGASAEGATAEVSPPPEPPTPRQAPPDAAAAPEMSPLTTAGPTPSILATASAAVDEPQSGAVNTSLPLDIAAAEPEPNGQPAHRTGRRGSGDSHEAPHLPNGPAVREEGTSR